MIFRSPEMALQKLEALSDVRVDLRCAGLIGACIGHQDEGNAIAIIVVIMDGLVVQYPGIAPSVRVSMSIAKKGNAMTSGTQQFR